MPLPTSNPPALTAILDFSTALTTTSPPVTSALSRIRELHFPKVFTTDTAKARPTPFPLLPTAPARDWAASRPANLPSRFCVRMAFAATPSVVVIFPSSIASASLWLTLTATPTEITLALTKGLMSEVAMFAPVA